MVIEVDGLNFVHDELTEDEIHDMISLAEDIVNRGKVDWDNKIWVEWRKSLCYDDRQALLTYSTVFPQRLLLAVSRRLHFLYKHCGG